MTGRMRARPPTRPAAAATMRRTRRVKRASAGLTPVRAGAALAMLLSAFAIYGVAASPAFEFDELRIEGATYTDTDAVQGILEQARGLARLGEVRSQDGSLAVESRRLLGCHDIDQRQVRDWLAQRGAAGEPLGQLAADHAGGPDHQYAQERPPWAAGVLPDGSA